MVKVVGVITGHRVVGGLLEVDVRCASVEIDDLILGTTVSGLDPGGSANVLNNAIEAAIKSFAAGDMGIVFGAPDTFRLLTKVD